LAYNLWWDANSGTTNIDLYEGLTGSTIVEGLNPGSQYQFKVRARNIYGYGEFSDTIILIPKAVPDMMASPTTSLDYPTVTIAWTTPFNNGNTINAYQIVIFSHVENDFIERTDLCDGADVTTFSLRECEIDMSYFFTDLGYSHTDLILVKARAANSVGWGSYSTQNPSGVFAQTEPAQMNLPLNDYDMMRDNRVKLDWQPLVTNFETGAVPILSYSLEYDQAVNDWVSVCGETSDYTQFTFTVEGGLLPGLVHSFRIRARNEHGWGPYSEYMEAKPSWVPTKMLPVTVEIENIYIKISWVLTSGNGGEVTNYRVVILADDNLTWLESEFCISTDPLLLANLYCYVPMDDLTTTFNLPYNRFISAKVQAYNLRGYGELSEINTLGVNAEVVPQVV
jgi:hypothetical protein